jgi:hypothetical protein
MSALTMKQLAMQCAMLTPTEKEIARSGAATVTFEDHGQDFLTWHIKDRHVVGCEPFQADLWVGLEITTLPMVGLRMGVRLSNGVESFIKYPIKNVEPFRGDVVMGSPA